MSGHSKWSQIKRQKEVTDKKKGKTFTKLSKNVSLAAKKGKDPGMNPALRQAIDAARAANMPKDNIDKAILRGAGELPGQEINEVTYEIYAPGGAAMIVQAVTDNKNRTTSEVKAILNRYGGKLGGVNSVAYMFQNRGILRINDAGEANQLKAIDAGALDVQEEEGGLTIYTEPGDLEKVKSVLGPVEYSAVELVPKNKLALSDPGAKGKIQKILDELDNNEDVEGVFINTDL